MPEILGSISPHYAHSFFGFSEYLPVLIKYILVHTCESFEIASTRKYILSWHSAAMVGTEV
jgi:hypothetical protein